jgi:hypothetical protein
VSEAEGGGASKHHADPLPFATPRIPKRDGQGADPSSPFVPISTRKIPQRELAAYYSMPGRPNRQLTKRDLSAFDFKLLNAIEAVVNSAPYLGDVSHSNDLILDTELRTSNALTHFFRDGEVTELQPGCNLLRVERAWEGVSNTVFFNAIRMACVSSRPSYMPVARLDP